MSSTLKEHSEDSFPPLFQFDGDDGSTDKFNKIKNEGYLFVDLTTKKCLPDNLNIKNQGNSSKNKLFLLSFIHNIFEFFYFQFPSIKYFLLANLFPYYAAYFFI